MSQIKNLIADIEDLGYDSTLLTIDEMILLREQGEQGSCSDFNQKAKFIDEEIEQIEKLHEVELIQSFGEHEKS